MTDHLLTAITFTPALFALLVSVVGGGDRRIRAVSMTGSLLSFALSAWLFAEFRPSRASMQFTETIPWIDAYGVRYALGVDGISLFLVLLTTVLTPVVIASSRTAIARRVREYHVFLLLLETAMLGTFFALDAVLFYVFWEAMLVPMYFLIGIWGGERRLYATIKFVLYTAAGSLLMLVALLYVVVAHKTQTGSYSTLLADLYRVQLPLATQVWLFGAFGLAFAIKVPIFPFHTWLPDAHVEAPTGGSVILAGVLLKMGTYGFLRWAMPLFPAAALAYAPWIVLLAAIGIVYGALVALVQPDVKRLVAYSSVSHLGYVMLGLFALDPERVYDAVPQVTGSVLQMVNHGLSTGALFLLVGILYERRHTREIAAFGGLARTMPIFAAILLFVTLSSIGLPGLNGFVGEFLILLGSFRAAPVATVAGAFGVVLGAVYMLWMFQRVALGEVTRAENRTVTDASGREVAYLLPILAAIVAIGVYPRPLLTRIEGSVRATLERVEAAGTPARVAAASGGVVDGGGSR